MDKYPLTIWRDDDDEDEEFLRLCKELQIAAETLNHQIPCALSSLRESSRLLSELSELTESLDG